MEGTPAPEFAVGLQNRPPIRKHESGSGRLSYLGSEIGIALDVGHTVALAAEARHFLRVFKNLSLT